MARRGPLINIKNMINIDDLNIKFKFTDQEGQTLAIVTIENEILSLRGFRIMKSKYKNQRSEFLRIVPPTYGARHHFSIFFNDKDFWYQLEDRIFDEYQIENVAKDINVETS